MPLQRVLLAPLGIMLAAAVHRRARLVQAVPCRLSQEQQPALSVLPTLTPWLARPFALSAHLAYIRRLALNIAAIVKPARTQPLQAFARAVLPDRTRTV